VKLENKNLMRNFSKIKHSENLASVSDNISNILLPVRLKSFQSHFNLEVLPLLYCEAELKTQCEVLRGLLEVTGKSH